MTIVKCPHCGQDAKLVTGEVIYPHRSDLFNRFFWRCEPCDAYVGCHEKDKGYGDGTRPLGTPANAALRRKRSAAHAALDPLWRKGKYRRREVYALLAIELMVPTDECHIGLFNTEQCDAVVRFAAKIGFVTQ